MKILNVIANLATRYGGPPKVCFEMARTMASLGHSVSIYTTNQDGPNELKVPIGCPLHKDRVEIRYFPIQRPRFWGYSFPLAKELEQMTKYFDIVHIHSLYLFHSMISGHYCRKYNIPYLIRPHGTLDPYIYKRHRLRKSLMELLFERKNFKYSHAINFATEEEKNLASDSPLMLKSKGIVVPLGLDLAEYENLPEYGTFRSKYPGISRNKIILFFGRINFKKGLEVLTRAFSKVTDFRADVNLVIAGPDNEGFGEKVKKLLAEEQILEHVIFTGLLKGKDKLSILRDADIFVLPSYSENFGISVIEAMACGLPVIISDRVNIWREVLDSGAGKVIPCDASQLAEAILELLDDVVLKEKMSLKGKGLVKERFEWSKIALKLEDVYRTMIQENPATVQK
jgi:glycosyltransferase involved in cell wall biosynthesis